MFVPFSSNKKNSCVLVYGTQDDIIPSSQYVYFLPLSLGEHEHKTYESSWFTI